MPRTILHVDLDAFYCSVEEQQNPALRGRAFAVGGRPESRGVVASCSYPARQRGVRSAMPMSTALRLCPGLQVVTPRHSLYRSISEQVMALLQSWSPRIEQLSIDEAFLDVSEFLTGELNAHTLALRIQQQIRDELELSCSIGVASNKMVAKIATDCGKAAGKQGGGNSPAAICVVPAGEEAEFLAPLPVSALWGVGPKTTERLASLGFATIGDLAARPLRELINLLGRQGYELAQHAHGIDKRDIITERPSKSISSETTFIHDVQDGDTLWETLEGQARDIVEQLQKQQLFCTTVKIKVRWPDFSFTTRQTTLAHPTAELASIEAAAGELLKQLWDGKTPVRLLGVGVSGFNQIRQLSLWDDEWNPYNSDSLEVANLKFELPD